MKKFSFEKMRNNVMAAAGILVVAVIFCGSLTGCKRKNINGNALTTVGGTKNESALNNGGASISKIVCLNPAGAEILFALDKGKLICGRSSFCDYPEEIFSVPEIGGFDGKSISLEKIISAKPDFVYASKGMHDFLQPQLEDLGIEIYLSQVNNISDLIDEIKFIGNRTNAPNTIEVCNFIKINLEKISKAHKGMEPKKVYWEIWNEPFMTCGKNSFINDVILAAGGVNIFADLESDYPMVSEESIISKNPEVIIIPDMNGVSAEMVASRNGWDGVDAVKLMNVSLVNADICSRPGPRIVDAVKMVEEIIWGL